MKTAILFGASGLIGGHILTLLLADKRYQKVICINRKALGNAHPKLVEFTGDLFNLKTFESAFAGVDDVFIAIGTTKAKTPDSEIYKKIDLGIPLAAGQLAKNAGAKNVCAVSSMGANAKSSVFYSALKGQMEDGLTEMNFENLNLVRPSLLLGDRSEHRLGEKGFAFFMTKLDFLIPEKYKAIKGETVAKAMVVLANKPHSKTVWSNEELKKLALEK